MWLDYAKQQDTSSRTPVDRMLRTVHPLVGTPEHLARPLCDTDGFRWFPKTGLLGISDGDTDTGLVFSGWAQNGDAKKWPRLWTQMSKKDLDISKSRL